MSSRRIHCTLTMYSLNPKERNFTLFGADFHSITGLRMGTDPAGVEFHPEAGVEKNHEFGRIFKPFFGSKVENQSGFNERRMNSTPRIRVKIEFHSLYLYLRMNFIAFIWS